MHTYVKFDGLCSVSVPINRYFIFLMSYRMWRRLGGKLLSAFVRSVLSPSSVPGSPKMLKMEIETVTSSETSVLCNI